MSVFATYICAIAALAIVLLGFLDVIRFGQGLGDLAYLLILLITGLVCLAVGRYSQSVMMNWGAVVIAFVIILYFIFKIETFDLSRL